MKHTVIAFIALILSAGCYSQSINIDSAYSLIKEKSIFSKKADWKQIHTGFTDKLSTAKNGIDSIRSLVYVFEQLGDVHSAITYNGRQYSNYPVFDDTTLQYLLPLVTKSQQQTGIIKKEMLQSKYLYLQVPGIQAWGEMTNRYAQSIADSLCTVDLKNISGYIIDLRLNGGGQLSAMLSGLNQLLGNSYVGGGVTDNGTEVNRFEIKDDNFTINTVAMTAIKNKCIGNIAGKPVVIIIGPVTRSSGSITAIAFKKRPHTFFIGEPTADGYSTGNDYFYFNPNFSLNLSTLYSQDRKKEVYKKSVHPDLTIKGGDNFDQLSADKKIIAAIEWLKKYNPH